MNVLDELFTVPKKIHHQSIVIYVIHLSSAGHFPLKCKTGEICKSYGEYIKTNHWQNIKSDFYASGLYKGQCEHCKDKEIKIHLHHQTYERIGHEFLTDLLPLCEPCHNFLHEFLKKYGRLPTQKDRQQRLELVFYEKKKENLSHKETINQILKECKAKENRKMKLFKERNPPQPKIRPEFLKFGKDYNTNE